MGEVTTPKEWLPQNAQNQYISHMDKEDWRGIHPCMWSKLMCFDFDFVTHH